MKASGPAEYLSRIRRAIPRRAPTRALHLALLLAMAAGAVRAAPPDPAGRPNVLLITIDTLRADRVGVYDPKRILTPHIDRFAAGAAVFTRAFAHTPTTLASHANILLGVTPPFHGVHDNANFIVRGEMLTLAECLKAAGYATGAFVGGFPLDSRFGLNQGFDIYDDRFTEGGPGIQQGRERRARAVWDAARGWIKGRRSPWFLWLHFFDPHEPYDPPEPFRSRYAAAPYDGEVAYSDSVVGAVLEELEASRLLPGTLVVVTGDHGESLGEHGEKTHGFLAYNSTLWIPLIIRAPGGEPRMIRQNVAHVDLFPTVCDVLGIRLPAGLQGRSLVPLLNGKSLPEKPIFFESLSPAANLGWAPITGFIDRSDKFIETPIPELFDLERDFAETENRAGRTPLAAYRDTLRRIVQVLTSPSSAGAGRAMDAEAQAKLRSLGYLAGRQGPATKAAGPSLDVKILLPLHNRAMDALDLVRAGRAKAGMDALKEIVSGGSPVSTAYLNLAVACKTLDRPEDAIEVLKAGMAALPDIYELLFQFIISLHEAGRFGEAVKAFASSGFSQTASDPVLWNYVGLAYFGLKDLAKASECYEQSLAIDPKFAAPHSNLGTLWTFQFKAENDPALYRKAVDAFARAIALDPGYGPAFHGLGVAHFQARD
jgi:arylsulfatase A-like enzyme